MINFIFELPKKKTPKNNNQTKQNKTKPIILKNDVEEHAVHMMGAGG